MNIIKKRCGMKKIVVLFSVFTLAGCGAVGIGSNHKTMLYNNSNDVISVVADSGTYKIKPDASLQIYSREEIAIQNKNSSCPQVTIARQLNSAAIFLDIIPGIMFGIVPIFVDAITNNLYKMPETYSYSCTD